MKSIAGLTAAYLAAVAVVFSIFVTSSGSAIGKVLLSEATFGLPMIIAFLLALIFRRVIARRSLLFFEIGFSIFSLLVFVSTFTGEHDAQYQLAVLVIPLIGFPAVFIFGLIAAFSAKGQQE